MSTSDSQVDAYKRGEPGSEAIANASHDQEKTSASSQLPRTSPATRAAIADLNNARQILSALFEVAEAINGDARFARAVVSTPTFLEDLHRGLVAAGRRIAAAVDRLTPEPVRCCKNCSTPLIAGADRNAAMLHCIYCGQVEDESGGILSPGIERLDVAALGRAELALEPNGVDVDVDAAIAGMRDRYHQALEGDEP